MKSFSLVDYATVICYLLTVIPPVTTMDFQLPLKVSRDANDNIDSDTVHDCSCPIADMLAVHSFISGDVDLTILYLLQYQAAEWQAEEWHLEIICFYA